MENIKWSTFSPLLDDGHVNIDMHCSPLYVCLLHRVASGLLVRTSRRYQLDILMLGQVTSLERESLFLDLLNVLRDNDDTFHMWCT